LTGAALRVEPDTVDIVATPDAVEYVRSHGGFLFVWTVTMEYGYHPVFVVEAAVESPGPDRDFLRFEGQGIELFLDAGAHDPPESLHLDVTGVLRKRIRASWNGHSFTPE
jgi:hypothetical protein